MPKVSTSRVKNSKPSRPTSSSSTTTSSKSRSSADPTEMPLDPDPGRTWEHAIRKLAKECGVDADDLVEQWHYRAAVRCYCGEQRLEEANANAFEDVRRMLSKEAA